MAFEIRFNEEKNQLLKASRGISFEDVVEALKKGDLLADIIHPNQKYSYQRIYIVNINEYVCGVPYVLDVKTQQIFLKTIYPSRRLAKRYMKGGK